MAKEDYKTQREKQRERPWLKMYVSDLDAEAFCEMSDSAYRTYHDLYRLAGKLDVDNLVYDNHGEVPRKIKALARILCRAEDELTKALEELEEVGLLERAGEHWRIVSYTEEQVDMKKVRESGEKRTAKSREKKKQGMAEPEPEPEPEPGRVSPSQAIYKSEIGEITELAQQQIAALCEKYTEQWFIDAVKEAALSNARSLKFIAAVLENWRIHGRDWKPGKQGGQGKQSSQAKPPVINRATPEELERVRALKAAGYDNGCGF